MSARSPRVMLRGILWGPATETMNDTLRLALKFTAVVMIVAVGALFSLVWYRSWTPFMDDGPFHGAACSGSPQRSPDQTFALPNSLLLESYDRKPGEASPAVLLRDSNHEVKWCIRASAVEGTEVRSIRFDSYRSFPFARPRARGIVDWTYGHETTWWFISSDGVLEEYWFSW